MRKLTHELTVEVFAKDLKTIREQKDISLKTIAQKTRLNQVVLEKLESGDFTFEPQAYIRAFIKQYAATLDLDTEEVLFDYDLAKSGKYKQKFLHEAESVQEEVAEVVPEPPKKHKPAPEELKQEVPEAPKAIVNIREEQIEEEEHEEVPEEEQEKKVQEETKQIIHEKEDDDDFDSSDETMSAQDSEEEFARQDETEEQASAVQDSGTEDVFKELPGHETKVRIVRDLPVQKTPLQIETQKQNRSFNPLTSPVFRNIALIVVGILILLGIYSLVNALFLDSGKGEPEIIRQNFDDVVKEQEKRILGVRTPEEIADSIKRSNDSLKAIKSDSLTFTITAVAYGEIYIVTDSANYNKPVKVVYNEGDVKTFKAKNSLHITTGDTKTFEAKLNGSPIEFDTKAVRKVKITSAGIKQ